MSGARPDTWIPFYVGDYLADTMHLARDQHGAYLMLIFAYWRRGSALPDDDIQLANIAHAAPGEWKTLKPILARFFTVKGGFWRHKRIDIELETAIRNVEKQKNRTMAANKRWGEREVDPEMPHKDRRSERLADAKTRGRHTTAEWNALLEIFEGRCLRCGATSAIVKDHITPIYKDGSDGIENLQPLCDKCNSGKGSDCTDYRENVCKDWREQLQKRLVTSDHFDDKTSTKRLHRVAETPAKSLHREGEGEGLLQERKGGEGSGLGDAGDDPPFDETEAA